MNCFPYFKDRLKSRKQSSAPELITHGNSCSSSTNPVVKSSVSASSTRGVPELYDVKASNLRVFTFAELRNATNGFSRLFEIGEGGFGTVYKGLIKPADGRGERIVVAIKKLNSDGLQGHKEWIAEVQFLGVVDHLNLVKLIGYCAVNEERGIQRLLVYEFMPNHSLDDHLFNAAYPALPWQTRLQIALGAAQGLAYLHEELEVQVIYRDFKASNVLLDKDFKPKLSDFGLAREGPTAGHTHVSTAVMGTQGYAAPDYVETGHLTAKSDVWSFGVVLFEILTGRRSLERNRPSKERKLLDWVKRFPPTSQRFNTIMDPRLEGQYSVSCARKMAVLAGSCLAKSSKERPKMSEVAERVRVLISDCDEDGPHKVDFESDQIEMDDEGVKADQSEGSESAKRRMAHLAKLGQHVGGMSRKGFMIMQRAKVN